MPWVHGDDYIKLRNAELKHLLILRNLPDTGTKARMVSRLRAHDHHHPFTFLKLPPELRNKIYTLVSSAHHPFLSRGRKRPDVGHPEGTACFDSFENVVVPSSLFRTCKQTYTEGRAVFYEKHCFKFFIEHGGCFLAIIRWLINMGPVNRSFIRQLHMRFKTKCVMNYKSYMDRIHQMLTDQATVVYIPKAIKTLWYIGQYYHSQNRTKAPLFKVVGFNSPLRLYDQFKITNYNRAMPEFRAFARGHSWSKYSLVFNPGESWFGQT